MSDVHIKHRNKPLTKVGLAPVSTRHLTGAIPCNYMPTWMYVLILVLADNAIATRLGLGRYIPSKVLSTVVKTFHFPLWSASFSYKLVVRLLPTILTSLSVTAYPALDCQRRPIEPSAPVQLSLECWLLRTYRVFRT